MRDYFGRIWASRYFWMHLALSDLRARWRRSFFGLLWCVIQPLGLTVLLAIVFSKMFNTNIVVYAPYLLSGIIVWECIMACVTGGSLSFVQADAYIKQSRHPLAIYTLRTVISSVLVFFLASSALWLWAAAVLPENIGWHWLSALTIFPIIAFILWPLSTILAYIGVRLRDIPHAMALVMQAVWFLSPVYFEVQMFRQGGMDLLVDWNPIYHLLQLVRAPLLDGSWPTLTNYLFCFSSAAAATIVAGLIGMREERKVIFYL